MAKPIELTTGSSSTNGHAARLATVALDLDLEALAERLAAAILTHLEKRQEPAIENQIPPLLLKPHQAAKVLCLSERTLWALKEAGEIPVVQVGRAIRYARSDLENWIARRRSGQPSLDK